SKPVKGAVTGQGNLTATYRRKSPFGVEALGTADAYDTNYPDIMSNTYYKQLVIANKNKFDKMLVKNGLALIAPAGKRVIINNEPAVPFPLEHRVLMTGEGGAIPQVKRIYVDRRLASEYRVASGVDPRMEIPGLTPVMNVANQAALAGLTDFVV